MTDIGVLALQGSVAEHIKMLSRLEGVNAREVRTKGELAGISGLIIPGGESTTIGKLIRDYGIAGPLQDLAKRGLPVWGTCAGMILMAREITGEKYSHLGLMDIAVKRNAYGSQLDSFTASAEIPGVAQRPVPLVFIRAPWVERVWGEAEELARVGGRTVAVRQGNLLATSFHPELTDDIAFHEYFYNIVKNAHILS